IDMLFGHLIKDTRLGCSGSDAVDCDVMVCRFLAQGLGESDDSGLRGAVGRRVWISFLTRNRGNVDDASVAPSEHLGNNGTAAEEHADEVDVDHLLPIVDRVLPRGVVGSGYSRISHEDIDGAMILESRCRSSFHAG